MRKWITAVLVLVGFVSFAQPTSGDIIMVEVDSMAKVEIDSTMLALAMTPEQAEKSFENLLVLAFKTGNAKKIAAYFGDNVDLSISGKANLYSKSQAEQVLQRFFTENKPLSFKIIHKGKAKKYFIGELISVKKKIYRVTINSKIDGNQKTITSLTIEEIEKN